MSTTRREFLLSTAGAAVGAIVPSFYYQALEFFERFSEPLLHAPKHVNQHLYVVDSGNGFELNLGDPFAGPPPMTWREYYDREYPGWFKHPERFDIDLDNCPDLDELTDYWDLEDDWALWSGPGPQARYFLESLDLGKILTDRKAPHGLEFFEESTMVSTWRGVRAYDKVTLSLLQQRLNDLGTGVFISTEYLN